LKSDEGAVFDKEVTFDASQIKPMITYGTNPGMGMPIDGTIPQIDEIDETGKISFEKSLNYMGFKPGQKLEGIRSTTSSWAAAPTAASRISAPSPTT
jgi:3-isopropylmalate/(R)-2-methylmalate dehydratase large subunit